MPTMYFGNHRFPSLAVRLDRILAVGVLLSSCSAFAQKPRPNVLLILIDNQSFFELSCHGHPQLKTPQIDCASC